jgi:hypothetical protein
MGGAGAIATLVLVATLAVQSAHGGASRSGGGSPAWVCPADLPPANAPGTITFYAVGVEGGGGCGALGLARACALQGSRRRARCAQLP